MNQSSQMDQDLGESATVPAKQTRRERLLSEHRCVQCAKPRAPGEDTTRCERCLAINAKQRKTKAGRKSARERGQRHYAANRTRIRERQNELAALKRELGICKLCSEPRHGKSLHCHEHRFTEAKRQRDSWRERKSIPDFAMWRSMRTDKPRWASWQSS